MEIAKRDGLVVDDERVDQNSFQKLVKAIFEQGENEDHLFALKLALFELPAITDSKKDELKKKFIKVFTHDKKLAAMDDIFQLTLCSGKSFIEDKYFKNGKFPKKNKLVSMIASDKVLCEAHEYRQEMIKKYTNFGVDHFGRGFNDVIRTNKLSTRGTRKYFFFSDNFIFQITKLCSKVRHLSCIFFYSVAKFIISYLLS